jgi:hypothetical protein
VEFDAIKFFWDEKGEGVMGFRYVKRISTKGRDRQGVAAEVNVVRAQAIDALVTLPLSRR